NAPQLALYNEIERQKKAGQPVRIIILKARQMGFSTAVAALFYHATITQQNVNSLVVAHKADASTNIFNKAKLFYEESPQILRPMRKSSNAKEMLFENASSGRDKMGNPGLRYKILIGTAVDKEAGRSMTSHNFHASELAFWPYPTETMAALSQTVPLQPNTMVIIESTANGIGGEFYERWIRAERGEGNFVPLFFPWYMLAEYAMPAPDGFKADDEEKELQEKFGLTNDQLQWRRWCIQNNCVGSLDIFHQEYPATPEEAFLSSGRPVFDVKALNDALLNAENPKLRGRVIEEKGMVIFQEVTNGYLSIWEMPRDGEDYVFGIDVAAGMTNGDFSVIEVFKRKTAEQVAEWHGHIDPDLLGNEAALLGRFYNLGRIIPESNNHGIATINALKRCGYQRIYRRRTVGTTENRTGIEYGFLTTGKTKSLAVNALGALIRSNAGKIKSANALRECLTFVWDNKGAPNAQSGCFDDRVMGMALAVYGMDEIPWHEHKDDYDNIVQLYGANQITGY
ncbi:MAG: hypothetical protein RR051_00340, partial [Clostridiales bacterium]